MTISPFAKIMPPIGMKKATVCSECGTDTPRLGFWFRINGVYFCSSHCEMKAKRKASDV